MQCVRKSQEATVSINQTLSLGNSSATQSFCRKSSLDLKRRLLAMRNLPAMVVVRVVQG
jgi:hypothetical protein